MFTNLIILINSDLISSGKTKFSMASCIKYLANIIYEWISKDISQEKLIQPYLIQKEPLKEPVFAVRLRAILNIFEAELCFNLM